MSQVTEYEEDAAPSLDEAESSITTILQALTRSNTMAGINPSASLDPKPTFLRGITLPAKSSVSSSSYLRIDSSPSSASSSSSSQSNVLRSPSLSLAALTRIAQASQSFSRTRSASPPASSVFSYQTPTRSQSNRTLPHFAHQPLTHVHCHEQDQATQGSLTQQSEQPSSSIQSVPFPTKRTKPRMIVGPVIGKVTDRTARILIELDATVNVRLTLTPQSHWYRPIRSVATATGTTAPSTDSQMTDLTVPTTASSDDGKPKGKRSLEDDTPELQSPTKQSKLHHSESFSSPMPDDVGTAATETRAVVQRIQAFRPMAFAVADLKPGTIYLAEFQIESSDDVGEFEQWNSEEIADRTGYFRTFPAAAATESNVKSASYPLNIIALSCDCASEAGRGSENLWKRLYEEYCCAASTTAADGSATKQPQQQPGFDLMLHIGDQVYADLAFAKAEVLLGTKSAADAGIREVDDEDDPSAATTTGDATANKCMRKQKMDLTREQQDALILDYYAEIYRHTWGDFYTRLVLSTGSHLMAADDHEYLNDFGSVQLSETDQRIARLARKAFHLYQRQLWDDSIVPLYEQAEETGRTGIDQTLLECSLHTFGSIGILIMDNRANKVFDESCSLFPIEQKEEEESNGVKSVIPHPHAYFGQKQWHQLYQWIRPPSSVSVPAHSTTTTSSYPSDALSILLVVNPSPAFFLGSHESERLISNDSLLDKLGLGLHPAEQGHYLNLFETWQKGDTTVTSASPIVPSSESRKVLFIGGDSHFGMESSIWKPTAKSIDSSNEATPQERNHTLIPAGVDVVFEQVIASAISSRRPKYSSYELWQKSLWRDNCLRGNTSNDKQNPHQVGPYFLTHTNMVYAHNFCVISANPAVEGSSVAAAAASISKKFVLSRAHEDEIQKLQSNPQV